MDINLFWLAIIVLISYSIQAMSGFGSTILALTLGVHLYPMAELLPVLVALDLLVNLYIATRHHRHINRPLLYRSIVPCMGVGLLAGIGTFHFFQGAVLETIFGFLVCGLASHELHRLFRNDRIRRTLSDLESAGYITAAGFIHGIYASGGPLLIYAVGRLDLPKSVFRSTLAAVWLLFSIILSVFYLYSGKLTGESLNRLLIFLPIICVGIISGEWLHRRINEFHFKIFIFAALLFAGLSIILA